MAVFRVLNNKKYRTSVRLPDGVLQPIRFEQAAYYGGVDESLYTTSNSQIIEALKRHPAFGVTVFLKEEEPAAPDTGDTETEIDLESLLPDPDNAIREETVTSAAKATTWLQANLDYIVPKDLSKDEIKIEAAKRGVIFSNWD